jgi:hypothetical protein
MRRALVLALAAAALGGCDLLTGDFSLSGTVDVAPRLRDRAPKTNAMLFIVAENEGGVPVAVRRIVNPEFPAEFSMGTEDLLVPAVRRRERLKVHAEMNTHGDVGNPKPGDLSGDYAGIVLPGEGGVRIVLDRQR